MWYQAAGSTESSRDGGVSLADKDDIMRTLLSHEKSASSSAAAAVGGGASTQSSSSDSDADDELNTNNYSGTDITGHLSSHDALVVNRGKCNIKR